jgi:hypothetical protein
MSKLFTSVQGGPVFGQGLTDCSAGVFAVALSLSFLLVPTPDRSLVRELSCAVGWDACPETSRSA